MVSYTSELYITFFFFFFNLGYFRLSNNFGTFFCLSINPSCKNEAMSRVLKSLEINLNDYNS